MSGPFDRAWDSAPTPRAPKPPTPFDVAWDAEDARKRGALNTATTAARDFDPNKIAEADALARRTNLPRGTVYRNLDEVRRLAGDRTFDPDEFVKEHPATARWLTDEMNAGVSKDDWNTLGSIERLVGGNWRTLNVGPIPVPVPTTGGALIRQWERQTASIRAARLVGEHGAGYVNIPAVKAEVDRLQALEQSIMVPEARNPIERVLLGTFAVLPSFAELAVSGQVTGAAVAGSAAGFAALAGQAGPQIALPEEAVTVPAAAAAGYAVGKTLGMYRAATQMMAGQNLLELERTERETGIPMSPLLKDLTSQSVGVVGGLMDTFVAGKWLTPYLRSAGRVLGLAGARVFANPTTRSAVWRGVRSHADQVGWEVVTETAQQATSLAGEQLARMAVDAPGVSGERVADELWTTAIETAIGMVLVPLPGVGLDFVSDMEQVRESYATRDRMLALGERTAESKTFVRSPDKFEELVREQVEHGGDARNVLMPVERFTTYWQSQNIDPQQAASELGIADQYAEAVEAGGDVVIPFAPYVTKVNAHPKHGKALVDDIRLRPGVPTAKEAKELDATIETEATKIRSEMETAKPENDSEQLVVDDVVAQLTLAASTMPAKTRYTPEQIATMAEGIARPYLALARKAKQDAFALYRRKNLRIVGPDQAEGMFETQAALEKAVKRKRSPEEIATLRTRLTQMVEGRATLRELLAAEKVKAGQTETQAADASGKLGALTKVTTDALVVEYLKRRDAQAQRTAELAAVLDTPDGLRAIEEVTAGNLEDALGLLDTPAAWGEDRLRQYRENVREWKRQRYPLIRLERELAKRGIENPDAYADERDLLGDASFSIDDMAFQLPLRKEGFARGELKPSQERLIEHAVTTMSSASTDTSERLPWISEDAYMAAFYDLLQRGEDVRQLDDPAHKPLVLRQAAFHGSPHKFDKVDLSKVGTGEGAQAYGWGFYSAEDVGVGAAYRRDLSTTQTLIDGEPIDASDPRYEAAIRVQTMGYAGALADAARDATSTFLTEDGRAAARRRSDIIRSLADHTITAEEGGFLYTLDIPDGAVAKMLDWDKPLSEQAPGVREALGRVVRDTLPANLSFGNASGGAIYEYLVRYVAEEKIAITRTVRGADREPIAKERVSKALLAAGIPGIKYLDAGSRGLVDLRWRAYAGYRTERKGWRTQVGDLSISDPDSQQHAYVTPMDGGEFEAMYEEMHPGEVKDIILGRFSTAREAKDAIAEKFSRTRNLVVFDDKLVTITHRNGEAVTPAERAEFLEQRSSDRPNAFLSLGVSQDTIGLMQTANLSSVMHEFSHDWLNLLGELATAEGATPEIQAEFDVVMKELGVTSRDQIGTKEQEHWARAVEKYLSDGKAPTKELQRLFSRFKAWMKQVYQAALANFAPVSPELRGVFDRMFAAESAVDEAMGATESLIESAEEGGMTEAEFVAHTQAIADQRERAEAAVFRALVVTAGSEIGLTLPERAQKALEADARQQVIEKEVRAEVEARPIQAAVKFLRAKSTPKEGKPSKAILQARYGPEIQTTLPKGTWTASGGIDPDMIAFSVGLDSGDTLVTQLQNYEADSVIIARETDRRMKAEFPDLVNDSPALADEAQKNLHEGVNDDVILNELKALGRSDASSPAPNIKAVKQVAAEMIDATPIRDLSPHRYLLAERKANKLAKEALRAGDIPRAAFHGRQQLLNHILYRYANRALEMERKALTLAGRLSSDGMQERLGLAGPEENRGLYRDAVNDLLTRYEFTRLSNKALDRRDNLRVWLAAQEEAGLPVQVSEELLADTQQRNYRTLTVAELGAVHRTLKQIHATALLKRKMLDAKDQRDFDTLRADAIATITKHSTMTQARYAADQTTMERVIDGLGYAHGLLVNPEMVARQLDGDVAGGVVQQATTEKINRASAEEFSMLKDAALTLKAIFDAIPLARVKDFLNKPLVVAGVNDGPSATVGRMKGWRAFWLALNWGNESSRAAILEARVKRKGQPIWTAEKVEKVLATLSDAEWDAIEAVWKWVDSYWPRISALQEEMVGVAPEKVEALPFTTASGRTVRGGYYPLKYDHRFSFKAWGRQLAEATGLKEGKPLTAFYSSASTKHGFTEARKGSGGSMVLLDGSVLQNHIVEVIHDLTHRKAVYDVNKFLNDGDVREAIEEAVGKGVYRMSLLPWLRRVAGERTPPTNSLEKIIDHARAGTSVATMGIKATTTLLQYSGYVPALDMVGPKWMAVGLKEFATNKREMTDTALAMSPALRERRESWDRDMRDAIKRDGPLTSKDVAWFYFTTTADMHVVIPVWWGEYSKHVAAGETTDQAVTAADQAVRLTQGAGKGKDLSTARAGGPLFRPFSMFYTYGSALYSMYWRSVRNVRQGRWSKARFVGSAMATWILPAVLEAWFRDAIGAGPDDDADDEEKAKWWAYQIAAYPLQTVLLLRDIARAVGPEGFDYKLSPVEDAFAALAKGIKAVGGAGLDWLDGEEEDEWTEAEVKALVNTAGYWLHLPSKQTIITGDYIYDWMMGYDTPDDPIEAGRNLLFARPRD